MLSDDVINVLLVGSGAREHALAWKITQSPKLGKLYIAPGNGGTGLAGENVPIGVMEFEKLADFAKEKNIALTVVGPENPLGAGIVDYFQAEGLRIWGPTQAAARIESSKSFAKQLMKEKDIPTAEYRSFKNYDEAVEYVRKKGTPIVVKADGLAVGKGVIVCQTLEEAEHALQKMMKEKIFAESGTEVVIEEFLMGQEITVQAFCDGRTYHLLPSTQDHKQVFDGDKGPNTGGMGAIGPVPWFTEEMMREVEMRIVKPMLEALRERGTPYVGCLYVGLMMTKDGPKVIEFNARFGDPECEVYMRLLKTDVLEALNACVDGTLDTLSLEWEATSACCVMLCSRGYPETSEKGVPIHGTDAAETTQDVVVFHMGTKLEEGTLKTNGGRVIGVSATGDTLKGALDRAYEAIGKIEFDGMHYRRDIGAKALES